MQSLSVQWKSFLVRVILPTVLTIVLFISSIFIIIIPVIEKISLDHKREMIRELTNSAWNILAKFEYDERRGLLTRQEAQRLAVEQIRNLHYGQQMKDYFWINDMHPRMVIHPYRSDLNGKDLSNYTDPNGKQVFIEFVNVVKKSGAGYIEYMWQWKDDQNRIVPKISYVKGFAPWGWIIGTGIYIEDVALEMASINRNVVLISLAIVAVIALLLIFLTVQNLQTERQRAETENALRASEEKYRIIFENTGTATVILNEDLVVMLANSEFEKLSGYTKADIEGKSIFSDFASGKDSEGLKSYCSASMFNTASAPHSFEFSFVTWKGHIRTVSFTTAVIPGSRSSVGSLLDITDQQQALHVLEESEERFRSLVENSHTGIFIVQNERIVYRNPEQERLFGPLPEGFTITNFQRVHPDDVEKVKIFYESLLSGEVQKADTDYRFYSSTDGHKSGAVRWAHCRANLIEYMGQKAILVNMMDVTRTRELENLLEAKDRMISLGHVAAGIAHEIRNPLSGVNMFLDGIRENFQDPESTEDIKTLISQAQAAAGKIETVIKRVLDFTRPGTPRFKPANINVAVNEALMLAHVTLRKSKISIHTDLAEDLPTIKIDLQQMEQVILNLINNAAEALKNRAGERIIAVSTALENGSVTIHVADSGPGIIAANREKIFDPFYTTKKDGSGIGLSICQRIITDHRGSISITGSQWGGAEFIIRIPSAYKG